MRERLVIAEDDRDAAGMAGGGGAHAFLQRGIAGAEHGELAAMGDDLVGGLDHEIDALLPGQPGDDAEDRAVGGGEAEALFERGAISGTAGEADAVVVCGDVLVLLGVPDGVVDAVDGADEIMDAFADQSFETHAELWLEN